MLPGVCSQGMSIRLPLLLINVFPFDITLETVTELYSSTADYGNQQSSQGKQSAQKCLAETRRKMDGEEEILW